MYKMSKISQLIKDLDEKAKEIATKTLIPARQALEKAIGDYQEQTEQLKLKRRKLLFCRFLLQILKRTSRFYILCPTLDKFFANFGAIW